MPRVTTMKSREEMSAGKPVKRISLAERLPELRNLTPEKLFERYNLLGYDNGDGELACSIVGYEKQVLAKRLSFSASRSVYHAPNILGFTDNGAILLDEDQLIKHQEKTYHNFKRCPGPDAKQLYRHSDHSASPDHTYEDLMAHSFACSLKLLFESNKDLDKEKNTIIMVGRPASPGWEQAEYKYEEILRKYLEKYLKDMAERITILVLSESLAAMAGAMELKQDQWLNAVVQILDMGSSTFDITIITPEGLAAEDSFQFGGSQLDDAIKEYGDDCCRREFSSKPECTIRPDHRRTARMRFLKEQYYGDNGENIGFGSDLSQVYTYSATKTGDTKLAKYHFDLSEHMNSVLNNTDKLDFMRCVTKHLGTTGLDDLRDEHDSWTAACEFVMARFHKEAEQVYRQKQGIPRRLILTGGVSNMPEVRELAEKVFGVKPETPKISPSITVSTGLALILGNEIIKKFLLEDLEQSLEKQLPEAETLLEELIQAAIKEDLDFYEQVIGEWAQGSEKKTLGSCLNMFSERFTKDTLFVQNGCENWFRNNGIEAQIREMLKQQFQSMFPQFPRDFVPNIHIPDFSGLAPRALDNTMEYSLYMFFDEENCPDAPSESNNFSPEQRKKILEVYRGHREGLTKGGDFFYGRRLHVPVTGIRDMYDQQLSVEQDAGPLRKKVLDLLRPQINGFVEDLTYYLAMSARQ